MGNTALRGWQIGIEATYGDAVAATRKLYPGAGSTLTRELAFHTPNLDMASYDEARAGRFRQLVTAGGSLSDVPLDTNMLIELLLMGVKAAVTGVQIGATGAYTWTFAPGDSLASATIEFDASGQIWRAYGCIVDELTISWAVGDPATVAAAIVAEEQAKRDNLTGAISDFALIPIQGWEVALHRAAAGTDPFGQAATTATLLGGEITISNNLQRRYFDDNTQTLEAIGRGKRRVECSLTLDLGTNAMAEYDNWAAGTERTVGLRFGNNVQAGSDAANKHKVDITLPGVWTAQAVGDADESSVLELTLENVWNTALGYAFNIVVINARAS